MGDMKKPEEEKPQPPETPEPPPFDPDLDLITEFERGLRDGKPSKSPDGGTLRQAGGAEGGGASGRQHPAATRPRNLYAKRVVGSAASTGRSPGTRATSRRWSLGGLARRLPSCRGPAR
jgi:hypothetical protein